jgi:two-component system nitrate/nitrite response regulator NarL
LMVCDASEYAHQDFQVLQEIGQEFPEIGIMILTDNLNRSDFDMAIAGGARTFLPKSISPVALQTVLELILLGENIFAIPASLSGGIPANPHTPEVSTATGPRKLLSAREAQILSCLEAGQPNKVIARNLDMAEATVKVHLKALLRKINAGNRTQAAVWSMNHKIAGGELDSRG